MKLKTLLIGLMTLAISFQTYAYSETKNLYYPTGEIEGVIEYVNGNPLKATRYHKTGEVMQIEELVNGKKSKATHYHKTGEINKVVGFVNGKESRRTFYHKTGEVKQVQEYINAEVEELYVYANSKVSEDTNGKLSKTTIYHKTGEVKQVEEFVNDKRSNQTFAYSETIYYPTGEIEAVGEVVNGKLSKSTQYYKTGEVEGVIEYVNGKLLKATRYYKTGEIQQIEEYINGKKSKVTFYFKTGEVSSVEKYPIQSLGKKDSHIPPISKEIKDNQNSFSNKVSNKKIVMSCVGDLFNIDPGADMTRIRPIETYWKDIVIKGDTLIAPKFGEYLYHREENGKKYWYPPDEDFSPGSPFSKKWNLAVLDTSTDKLDISLYKEGMVDLMQGKCSIKTKTSWN